MIDKYHSFEQPSKAQIWKIFKWFRNICIKIYSHCISIQIFAFDSLEYSSIFNSFFIMSVCFVYFIKKKEKFHHHIQVVNFFLKYFSIYFNLWQIVLTKIQVYYKKEIRLRNRFF